MSQSIHTIVFNPPNWMILSTELSQIDRFDGAWQAIERREGKALKELKSIATVRSVGASTRIEGAQLTDDEVSLLINRLSVTPLTERDQQEVAGYYECLQLIAESWREIPITESSIKQLHKVLMSQSNNDSWHRGDYKQHENKVIEQGGQAGSRTIFQTTAPGYPTQDAMNALVTWYAADTTTPALIRIAIFIYDFLSIHPFQDGNGRLSRLITTLLLLKSGYSWIEYVSFEHEIEARKAEYYKVLMACQQYRPGEEVAPWVLFFLSCLQNLQRSLSDKMERRERRDNIGMREKRIYDFIEAHPGSRSGEIAKGLKIPLSTIKRIVGEMVRTNQLIIHGAGAGTHYSVAITDPVRRDITMRFTNTERVKEFTLSRMGAFVKIKKIILAPRFDWKHPDEWSKKLVQNGLYLTINAWNSQGAIVSQPYSIFSFNDPNDYHPAFTLRYPIDIPDPAWEMVQFKINYPIRVQIELSGTVDQFDFDVMLVMDEG